LDKDIYSDDKKLDQFIKENELLKIFESKKKLGEDFERKIEKEIGNALIKFFVYYPTIFYNFSEEEEKANEIINYLIEVLFHLIYCYLSQHNDIEKYHLINQKLCRIKSEILEPEKIKKCFEIYSREKKIDIQYLKDLFQTSNLSNQLKDEINNLISQVDTHKEHNINFNQFLYIIYKFNV
jgi:hypothetical protein